MQAGKFIPASDISPICLDGMYPCYGGNGIRGFVDHYSVEGDYPIIGRQGALCGNVNMTHGKFYATEHAVVVTPMLNIDLNWLYYTLIGLNLNQYSAGAAQPGLAVSNLLKVRLLLPPLNEQKRIANAINEALSIIQTVDKYKQDLALIIQSVKSKILELAIRGKLVPQDPNDEPAYVLLERIRAEKEELIKQGKIKRDKKESIIFKGDDNSYYDDLPSNWSVSSLAEITTPLILNDGDWILSNNMVPFGEIKLIQLGSVGFLNYIDKGFKYLTPEMFEKLNCTEIQSGYMLINRIVSDKMCACILPQIEGKKITTVDTCWIAPHSEWYNIKYILYAISSPLYQSLVMFYSSGTTRKRISKSNLINLPLLIPPLAEQERIVNAVEALFAHLDKIAESLS